MLDVIPLVMRTIRRQMRGGRMPELTIPQFRTLMFVHRERVVTLSEAAEFMGLTLPSMSRMVEGLVSRQLMRRSAQENDRRKLALEVTESGRAMVVMAERLAHEKMVGLLSAASSEQLLAMTQGLQMIENVFQAANQAAVPETKPKKESNSLVRRSR